MKRLVPILIILLSSQATFAQDGEATVANSALFFGIPNDAIIAGQVQFGSLLDIDRLERLMGGFGAILGDEADAVQLQMRQLYNDELAEFAENLGTCVIFWTELGGEPQAVACDGNFGEGGLEVLLDDSMASVVDEHLLVAGPGAAEILGRLQLADETNSGNIGGVPLDAEALAHFVVRVDEDMANELSRADMGMPLGALESLQVVVRHDLTQLGGINLEVRLTSADSETAHQIYGFFLLAMMGMSGELSPYLDALGLTTDDLSSWISVDGASIVFSPESEALVGAVAVGVPFFIDMVRSQQAADTEAALHELAAAVVAYQLSTGSMPIAAPLTPSEVPCGNRVGPDMTWWETPPWTAVGFSRVEPQRFSYELINDGVSGRVTVRAVGDLDCDGVRSTYEIDIFSSSDGLETSDLRAINELE